jgi:hypothetical protein
MMGSSEKSTIAARWKRGSIDPLDVGELGSEEALRPCSKSELTTRITQYNCVPLRGFDAAHANSVAQIKKVALRLAHLKLRHGAGRVWMHSSYDFAVQLRKIGLLSN